MIEKASSTGFVSQSSGSYEVVIQEELMECEVNGNYLSQCTCHGDTVNVNINETKECSSSGYLPWK